MMSYDTNLYWLLIYLTRREVLGVKMERVIIQLPPTLKRQLESLRTQGTTASGFIRWLLEQHFREASQIKKGR